MNGKDRLNDLEEDDDQKQASNIIRTISRSCSNFRLLNQELHMVLFFGSCIYDFIPQSREIRPYNSCHWYKIEEDSGYDKALDYLSSIYAEFEDRNNSGEGCDDLTIALGIKVDSIIAIDLEKTIKFLKNFSREINTDSDEFETVMDETNVLIEECDKLMSHMKTTYEFWDERLLKINIPEF